MRVEKCEIAPTVIAFGISHFRISHFALPHFALRISSFLLSLTG